MVAREHAPAWGHAFFCRTVRSAHFTHFFLGAVLVNTLVVLPLEHRDLVRIASRAHRTEAAHPSRDARTEAAEDAHAAAIWCTFELSFSALYVRSLAMTTTRTFSSFILLPTD